jgi:hypothetical protein
MLVLLSGNEQELHLAPVGRLLVDQVQSATPKLRTGRVLLRTLFKPALRSPLSNVVGDSPVNSPVVRCNDHLLPSLRAPCLELEGRPPKHEVQQRTVY